MHCLNEATIPLHNVLHLYVCYIYHTPLSPADQALSEARATLEQIKEEMQAWQTQHNALHKKLKTEKAANSTLKVKTECNDTIM